MIRFPFEDAAKALDPLPDGLDLPDTGAYIALREIYRAYRSKNLSREKAGEEKRRLFRTWEKARTEWDHWERLGKYRERVLRETEVAKTACRKEPTGENARRLCRAIDGICPQDRAGIAQDESKG